AHVEPRDKDITGVNLKLVLSVDWISTAIDPLVVDANLVFAGDVIVDDHFLATYNCHFALFAWIEPTSVNVTEYRSGKMQRQENHILYLAVQASCPMTTDGLRHLA